MVFRVVSLNVSHLPFMWLGISVGPICCQLGVPHGVATQYVVLMGINSPSFTTLNCAFSHRNLIGLTGC